MIRERLTLLTDRIAKGSIAEDEIQRELRDLLDVFDNADGAANYREKIQGAIHWAGKYFGKQTSTAHGGPKRLRAFLLQDLSSAASIAGQMKDDRK